MNIAVKDLTFTYPSGVTALREVTLHVAAGEAVAIVGENGAGKTTLIRHFNGLLQPGAGQVFIGDWDTRQHTVAQLAHRVGYLFQNPDDQLFARTVWDEVAFGPRNLGYQAPALPEMVDQALDQVGLAGQAQAHPYDLQLTQRRLVALAAVLAMDTPILLLDEPTTGQDARGVSRIGDIVEMLKGDGKTVVTVSHDIDFCADHFERVVVMSGGRVLADGPAPVILSQAELLAGADVEPPQLARLAAALGLPGAPETLPATASAFAAALVARAAERPAAGPSAADQG